MLKTNCKIVKERIRNYIKECLNAEMEMNPGVTIESMVEQFNDLSKYDKSYNSISYCFGCDFGYFAFTYDDMRDLLKSWLDETEEEANKYNNQKVSDLFFSLLDREIEKTLNIQRVIRYDYRGVVRSGIGYVAYKFNKMEG